MKNTDFKEQLAQEGLTMKDWARQRGYNPQVVSEVYRGVRKGLRGKANEIARAINLFTATAAGGAAK